MKVYVIFNGKGSAADNMSAAEYVIRSKTEYEKTAVFFGCSPNEPQIRTCLSMGFDDAYVIDCDIMQAERALSLFVLEKALPGDAVVCGEHCWDDGICPASAGISERTGIEVEEISVSGVVPHTPSIRDIMSGMSKPITSVDPADAEVPTKILCTFSLKIPGKCIIFTQERNDVIRLISMLRQS